MNPLDWNRSLFIPVWPQSKSTSHALASAQQGVLCHAACRSGQGTINQLDFVPACNGDRGPSYNKGSQAVQFLRGLRPILTTSRLLCYSGWNKEGDSIWRMQRSGWEEHVAQGWECKTSTPAWLARLAFLHKHRRDIFRVKWLFCVFKLLRGWWFSVIAFTVGRLGFRDWFQQTARFSVSIAHNRTLSVHKLLF